MKKYRVYIPLLCAITFVCAHAAFGQTQVKELETKGTPFEGTQVGINKKNKQAPNAITIVYKGTCTERCTKMVFIQMVCETVTFEDGTSRPTNPSDIIPPGPEKENKWRPKDRVTVNGENRLCHTDFNAGEKDPYYNGGDAQDYSTQGKHGADAKDTKSPSMDDTPNRTDRAFNMLLRKYGKRVKKISVQFETCAFCAEGNDAGKFYGCLNWQYEREKDKEGKSTTMSLENEPSKKFRDALDKWVKTYNFPLPKTRPDVVPK